MIRLPIYAKIASEIQEKARNGFFPDGGRLPSRNELCEKYKISSMTAVKVHNELEKVGIAYKVRGKGVFSHPLWQSSNVSVSTPPNIVIHNWRHSHSETTLCNHMYGIVTGIQKRAFELGLNCRTEILSSERNGSYSLGENDALLVPYEARCEWMLPMLKRKRIRCVMINNYFPESHCVIFDNYHGIALLLDHLESMKCRKIFLCTRHFDGLGMANLSERTYAFDNECRRRGLEHKILTDGNYRKLVKMIKSEQPDAIMFTSDNGALKLRELLLETKLEKQPVITGFDDLEAKSRDLVTIKVDYAEMGRKAVDIAVNNKLEDWTLPDITRVQGELVNI